MIEVVVVAIKVQRCSKFNSEGREENEKLWSDTGRRETWMKRWVLSCER